MVIKINYTSSDVYVSTSVSPVYVVVNYSGVSGGGGVWGQITGTLSNQTDLQMALDNKFDDPTGDTTQYIAGDGSLVAFPISGQAGTIVREVRNITGATLTKGTVVYINGASGNKPTVTKAIATSDATSAQTFGLIQADITNNSNGYIVAVGDLDGLNTSAFADGTQLYLSATTAGGYTSTKQYAPNHLVYIGVVTRSHINQGRIEVRIQNGYEMDELHNVSAQSPSNNDGLFYNTSTSLWENKQISTALGYTPVTTTRLVNTTSPLVGGGDLSSDRTISIPAATSLVSGHLTSTDWNTFNNKQNALGYTPVPTTRTLTINGTTYDLSADRSWTISSENIYTADGTLTSARSLTHGGFNLSFIGGTYTNRFTAAGRLLLGTTTESTYLLDVNGTARVSGQITGRTLSNSTGASDYAIELNGISTTDATTRILINCGTVSSTGAGFGARILNATVSDYGVGTFINANGNTSIGHVVTTAINSLAIRGFAVRTNGQGTNGSIAYTWFNGNNVDFYHSIHNDGTYHNLRLYNSAGGIYYVRDLNTTNITFGSYTHYASAQVAIDSTSRGFLPPRMTTTQKNAISSPAAGLIVYDTTLNSVSVYDGATWRNDTDTVTTNRQTASYTLALTDRGKLVEMNVATANNLTVPLNSSIAFPIGTKIDLSQYGAGQTTIVATGGVTIRSAGGALKLRLQYSGASLVKIGTDEWYLFGDITV